MNTKKTKKNGKPGKYSSVWTLLIHGQNEVNI